MANPSPQAAPPAQTPPAQTRPALSSSALSPRARRQLAMVCGAVVLLVGLWLVLRLSEMGPSGALTLDIDFRVFWAAGALASDGAPLAALDPGALAALFGPGAPQANWMPFAYPPGFLVLMMPFGLLPFGAAWGLFTALSLAALLLAARAASHGDRLVALALLGAPAYLPALMIGQTSALWVAGLVAALAALGRDRVILAGVLISCLTLKPQLGLLVAVALLAYGAWRAIAVASVTAMIAAGLATIITGPAYWPALHRAMGQHYTTIRDTIADTPLMVSVFGLASDLGLGAGPAMALQWTVALGAAGLVAFAFRGATTGRVPFDLACGVLCGAILLSGPYMWYYETALLAPAALYLWRSDTLPPHALIQTALMLPWLGLGPALIASRLVEGAGVDFIRPLAMVLIALTLGLCALALWRSRTRPPLSPSP